MKGIPVIILINDEEKWFASMNSAAAAIGCSCTTISNIYNKKNYRKNHFGIKNIWISNEEKVKLDNQEKKCYNNNIM